MSIIEQFSKSNLLRFTADVETSEALIKINKIYFPGVKVYLNEKELQPFSEVIIPSGEPSYSKEDNGLKYFPRITTFLLLESFSTFSINSTLIPKN